ncbi:hypothetical protein ASB7_04330 [Helicobacter ailurogastricus]|nr:hypothetical protein ASB7_04330 [Helicobacter ailurogastricus]
MIERGRKALKDWENILNLTSDHYILCGWVDFLLDFSDEKFDGKIEPISQSSEPSKYQCPNLEKFQQYAHLTMLIYSEIISQRVSCPIPEGVFVHGRL